MKYEFPGAHSDCTILMLRNDWLFIVSRCPASYLTTLPSVDFSHWCKYHAQQINTFACMKL